jgi:putative oxidoreductase
MKIVLWVLQVLLAVFFLMTGIQKVMQPISALAPMMGWVTAVPEGLVRFVGVAEVLGALGLVLPSLTKIQPRLTVWAAIGLVVVMVLAMVFHVTRGEFGNLVFNAVLAALAAVVAFGRSRIAPIVPRLAAA